MLWPWGTIILDCGSWTILLFKSIQYLISLSSQERSYCTIIGCALLQTLGLPRVNSPHVNCWLREHSPVSAAASSVSEVVAQSVFSQRNQRSLLIPIALANLYPLRRYRLHLDLLHKPPSSTPAWLPLCSAHGGLQLHSSSSTSLPPSALLTPQCHLCFNLTCSIHHRGWSEVTWSFPHYVPLHLLTAHSLLSITTEIPSHLWL